MITGNVIGGLIKTPDTVILVDENGTEYTAVATGEEVDLDATVNDIRLGSVAATNTGVTVGEKVIPAYHVCEGQRIITKGSAVTIPNLDSRIDSYDYTKIQALICLFNSSMDNSVSTEKVIIGDSVYNIQSTESITVLVKNHETKLIDLGITNNSDSMWILRFFMYKEIK